jgi:hypothetical protein
VENVVKHSSNSLIFVSIAAYRDAQLVPTIRDCFAKARQPDRLRFGICWQHDAEEPPLPFADTDRFRILDVDWRESRGACWARAEIMKLWRGEDYFLQVDSHCRFAPGWDEKLIAEMALTGSAKPLLSTYATAFTPATEPGQRENLGGGAHRMAIQGFTSEGLPLLKPVEIPLLPPRTHPLRARFLAAGFIFTSGSFVEEVGYDPELYFFGEEIAMTLRAYTHGYDLFHPHECVVWHDYVRAYAKRHWQDHALFDAKAKEIRRGFEELDQRSREKIHRLLSGEPVDTFGLGPARTLVQYEQYAGISFRHRKVQDYTRRSLEPPNPPAPPGWEDEIYPWLVRVMIDPKRLSPGAFDQPSFWYVALHDENGHEIYRRDFPGSELQGITGNEEKIALVCELESGIIPVSWTVWPVNSHNGWLNKLRGTLADDDYAIVRD